MIDSPNQTSITSENLLLVARQKLELKGITDIISFDESSVILKIEHTTLTVEGDGLHICKLSLETREVSIEGKIRGIFYSDVGIKNAFFRLWGKHHAD